MAQKNRAWMGQRGQTVGESSNLGCCLVFYETLILFFPNGSYTELQFPKRTLFLLFGATNYENRFKAP